MEDLTNIAQYTLELFGMNLVFNLETIYMTWIVMAAESLSGGGRAFCGHVLRSDPGRPG